MPTFRTRSDIAPLTPLPRQGSMPRLRDPVPISRTSVEGQSIEYLRSSSSSRDLRRLTSSLDLGSVPACAGATSTMDSISRPRSIRPLPPIPTTTPPCYTEFCPPDHPTVRVIRPLPSPPTSPSRPDKIDNSQSPTQHQNVAATTTPTKPSRSVPLAPDAPVPSVRLVSPGTRPTLPQLVTDAELLKPPSHSDPVPASNSPATPQPLTPQTAKQKRVNKLRRHLGERIPDEAVPIIQVAPQDKKGDSERLQKLGVGVDSIYLRAAITVGKILNIPDDGGSDRSSVASEEDDTYEWDLVDRRECRSMNRRESRKWVREKGGRRWEESNYENILQALRAL